MEWQSMTEAQIWDKINSAVTRMSPQQGRLWDCVKIIPAKWESSYGAGGSSYWAVAVLGQTVVWYDDIENGFRCSAYSRYGSIADRFSIEDDLEVVVQQMLNRL